MGKNKNLQAEFNFLKTTITAKATPEDEPGGPPCDQSDGSAAPAVAPAPSLDAVLAGVEAPSGEWPKAALRAIMQRFGRMPRFGWARTHRFFCGKFSADISIDEFVKKAREALVTASGRACSAHRFKSEATKRLKTVEDIFEEKTLREAKISLETGKLFRERLASIKGLEVDQVPRTRKVASEKVDLLQLDAVRRAVADHVGRYPPRAMSGIARILQAAQAAYQDATATQRKPSVWRESIESKISNLNGQADLLTRARSFETLKGDEKKEAKRALQGLGLCLGKCSDLTAAISTLHERARVYSKKLEVYESRKEFRRQNQSFELYRKRFYNRVEGETKVEHGVTTGEIREFWEKMWEKGECREEEKYENYLRMHDPGVEDQTVFPSWTEFEEMIRFLPSWKAAGCDGVFNFFIKKMDALHEHIYRVARSVCLDDQEQEAWFYKGLTYLIPKGVPTGGKDFRPITCMSNLYKLTTKCATRVMQLEVERRGLVAENQLGTVRMVQGAKEQVLLNLAVNRANRNRLATAWIDVKKAFDSVDHAYLIRCVECASFPEWITRFLKRIVGLWQLDIMAGGEKVLEKKVNRGILQGDSLSPLLFILCMDPLSRRLNMQHPKVAVTTPYGNHVTNHLLYVDDLKLIAESDEVLSSMMEETKSFFGSVGLEMNRGKSATNREVCASDAELLEGTQSYKYLGIAEDGNSMPTTSMFGRIKDEVLRRAEALCKTRLNGRNMIRAINEYAISVINYHVGVLKLEPRDFQDLDQQIRMVLVHNGIHLQPACKERLYLPRAEMGRGLHSVEHRSEHMLLQLHNALAESAPTSLRRAAILQVEKSTVQRI